jgi:hypothetical protein
VWGGAGKVVGRVLGRDYSLDLLGVELRVEQGDG